jgi:diguanylate cyclase (GGDEF)-like protein
VADAAALNPLNHERMNARRIPTIRSRLVWLVMACVVPASLMVIGLIVHDVQRERARLVRDVTATARAITSAVDRDLASVESALRALASSPSLRANDLATFYSQSKEVQRDLIAANIVLSEANGLQRLNTLRPFGDVLPLAGSMGLARRVFETGRPVVSDLFIGPVSRRPLIVIAVPARRDGTVVYSLSAGIFPERLSTLLTQQRLPPDWTATILDGSGTVVARTADTERFVGQPGPSALLQRMATAAEGALESQTPEGVRTTSVFARSAVSRFAVAIDIPEASLNHALWRSIGWLVVATVLLLASSLGLAWWIGKRIAGAVHRLTQPALALGRGQAVSIPSLPLREADDVAQSLMKASAMMLQARHDAYHDELTGLANRTLFNEILQQQLALSRRTGDPLAVLFIDLDAFKPINDRHGHAVGDQLLRTVAARLATGLRGSDIAARFGGDEFAAILVQASRDAAATVAAKLVDSLSAPYPIGALTIEVSASIGIAEYPACGDSGEVLLQRADAAMYQAKLEGRHRYAFAAVRPGAQTQG